MKKNSAKELLQKVGTLAALIILCAIFCITMPDKFPKIGNLMNILKQASINCLIASGMLCCLITAGIDLSVGSNCVLCTCTIGVLVQSFGITNPASVQAVYTYIAEKPCNYLKYYQDHGYIESLINKIAEKKTKMIMEIKSKNEMDKILKPSCPYFNGSKFIPNKYNVIEEELICWSETSLKAPLDLDTHKTRICSGDNLLL